MDDVRIQIVNFKTKKYLVECLETLFQDLRRSEITYQVTILDNASGDDLSDIATLFPTENIEVHLSKCNLGFGAGHNFLARQREARYLFLLNPDTQIVAPQTITTLLQRAVETRSDVVGPRLVGEDGKTQRWDHGELDGWKAWIILNSGNSYWRERKAIVAAAWVSGAALLINKQSFDALDGFDEKFFLYKEEEELCWRLRARGGRISYDPTISVFHHNGVVAKKAEHLRNSTDYFLQKHFHSRIGYSVFRMINKMLH